MASNIYSQYLQLALNLLKYSNTKNWLNTTHTMNYISTTPGTTLTEKVY